MTDTTSSDIGADFLVSQSSDIGIDSKESHYQTVINNFIDNNICGESASCIVYKMRLGNLLVAVKRLKKSYLIDSRYRHAFKKEFELGQSLKHDALPTYRELRDDLDEVYIVKDFIDGISVDEFIKSPEGRNYFSTPENVRRFLSQLVNVVAYLHRSGVVHCDLKLANSMLRHTDRQLMLIDLDKAYSDTHDTTHGGTAGKSESLKDGQKPTAQKDFAAIGKMLDDLEADVPKFPKSQFRKFRRLCDDQNVTVEQLDEALKPSHSFAKWIIPVVVVGLFLGGWLLLHQPHSQSDITSINETTQNVDTVVKPIVENGNNDIVVNQPPPITTHPEVAETSQSRMYVDGQEHHWDELIREINISLNRLRKDSISRSEIGRMNLYISNLKISYDQSLMNKYRIAYPNKPDIDRQLEAVRAFERSKAYKPYMDFMKEIGDTIRQRNKALGLDFPEVEQLLDSHE